MQSVFLGEPGPINRVYTEKQKEFLRNEANLNTDAIISKDNIAEHLNLTRNADYAFSTWGIPKFTQEEIINYFPRLKAVFYAAGSVAYFAREYLENDIKIFSAWAANAVPVAEFASAQIILANKCYYHASSLFSRGLYEEASKYKRSLPGNYNTSIGILGAGMIGKLVIHMLSERDINILVFDPFLSEEDAAALGVEKAGLNDVFKRCSVVSNHLANKPETVGMIGFEQFSLMPEFSTFINTGRGAQVREPELIRYLSENPDSCAVLDVTFPEPPVAGSKLYELPNVFLTPHIAGSLGNETPRMAQYIIEEFNSFKNGNPTRFEVTLKMLETMA